MRPQLSLLRIIPVVALALVAVLLLLLLSRSRVRPLNAQAPEPASAKSAGEPAVDKKLLRYDGKDFAYWRTYLQTELKSERRVEALTALAAFGTAGYEKEAVETILTFVRDHRVLTLRDGSDADKSVIEQTAKTLARIGPTALPAIVAGLKDRRSCLFCAAYVIEARPELPAPLQQEVLQTALHEDLEIRWTTVAILDKPSFDRGVLLKESQTRRRLAAALSDLVAYRAESAQELSFGPRDLFELIGSLGADGAPAVPALLSFVKTRTKAAKDDDYDLRAAAEALGQIGTEPERVVPALLAALDHPHIGVRAVAARAIGKYGPRARFIEPRLWAALKQRKPVFTATSSGVLSTVGYQTPAVENHATPATKPDTRRPEEPAVYFEMLNALTLIGEDPGKAVPGLVDVFKMVDADVRIEICEVFGRIGPKAIEALPALEEELKMSAVVQRRITLEKAIRSIKKETN
jgi:HEAT repeat protein